MVCSAESVLMLDMQVCLYSVHGSLGVSDRLCCRVSYFPFSFFPSFLVAIPLSFAFVCSICRCGKKGGGLILVFTCLLLWFHFVLSVCFA